MKFIWSLCNKVMDFSNDLFAILLVCTGLILPAVTSPANSSDGVESQIPKIYNILDACKYANIPLSNCSCELYGYPDVPPGFCAKSGAPAIQFFFSCTKEKDYLEASVIISICTLSVISNLLVIVVTIKQRQVRKLSNFKKLIALLSLNDLVFSILDIIVAVPKYSSCLWQYKLFFCKLFMGTFMLSGIVSIGFILIIALERYWGIINPLRDFYLQRHLWLLIVMNFVVSLLLVTPVFVKADIDEFGICVADDESGDGGDISYALFMLIAGFFFPLFAIVFLYVRIIIHLYSSVNQAQHMRDEQLAVRMKANRRIMILFICIVVAFTCLVLPNRVIWLTWTVKGTDYFTRDTYFTMKYLKLFPYLFHLCVNPLIYSAIDRDFRATLLTMFRCNCLASKYRPNSMNSSQINSANFSQSNNTNFSQSNNTTSTMQQVGTFCRI